WFQGRAIRGVGEVGWFTPDGTEMSEEDWKNGFAKSLGVFLNGETIASPGPRGERVVDSSFYIPFNAHYEPLDFVLPGPPFGERWQVVLDTPEPFPRESQVHPGGAKVRVADRALLMLRRVG